MERVLVTDKTATKVEGMRLWKSIKGGFFLNEDAANRDGATHDICECLGVKMIGLALCDECTDKRQLEKYKALPKTPYAGGMLFLDDGNEGLYFDAMEPLAEWCDDSGIYLDDAQVYLAEENRPGELDESFFSDYLGDGQDLPEEFMEFIDDFNARLRKLPPLTWVSSGVAVAVPTV